MKNYMTRLGLILSLLTFTLACGEATTFSGSNGSKSETNSGESEQRVNQSNYDPMCIDCNSGPSVEEHPDAPIKFDQKVVELEYSSCTIYNYEIGESCDVNEVMMQINDGGKHGMYTMACCGVSPDVFSLDSSTHFIEREGSCNDDEVAVGVKPGSSSNRNFPMLCSKIDTRYFNLEESTTAKKAYSRDADQYGELASAVRNGPVGDSCLCTDNSIMIGNHARGDHYESCSDQCKKLEIKPEFLSDRLSN